MLLRTQLGPLCILPPPSYQTAATQDPFYHDTKMAEDNNLFNVSVPVLIWSPTLYTLICSLTAH